MTNSDDNNVIIIIYNQNLYVLPINLFNNDHFASKKFRICCNNVNVLKRKMFID